MQVHTADGRFYLQYTRNKEGVLIGEVARAQLMPYDETALGSTERGSEAKEGEIAGCFQEGTIITPVYFSYYDPAGSGRQITREEYVRMRSGVVYESVLGLPKELTGLLGF